MLGYDRIPDRWKSGIPRIAATKFKFTSYSFDEITRSTIDRALKVIESAGGKVKPMEVLIPLQPAHPPALEQWGVDPPTARIAFSDAAWTWSAGWREATENERPSPPTMKATEESGAEAILRFRGTGVSVAGRCSQRGGRANVYLDGEKAGEIDAYVVPRTHDNDYWHLTGLRSGEHTLRIVTRADKDERSTGTRIGIERAIVYGR